MLFRGILIKLSRTIIVRKVKSQDLLVFKNIVTCQFNKIYTVTMPSKVSKNWSVYNFVKLTQQQQRAGDSGDSCTRERSVSLRKNSQWDVLIRKLSTSPNSGTESRRQSHKTLSIPTVKRSVKTFPTGSTYEGTWTILGMSGYGIYTFPTGAVYEGYFDDGMFHGSGKLMYANGTVLHGAWERGELKERQLIFIDGVEYKDEEWSYAKLPDRRYQIELLHGLRPAGRSHITPTSSEDIPPGFYDTGDGFFIPEFRSNCSYNDHLDVIRSPSQNEQDWILQNCRKGDLKSVGPKPELYEVFYEPSEKLDPTCTVDDLENTKNYLVDLEKKKKQALLKSLGLTAWREYHCDHSSEASGNTPEPTIPEDKTEKTNTSELVLK